MTWFPASNLCIASDPKVTQSSSTRVVRRNLEFHCLPITVRACADDSGKDLQPIACRVRTNQTVPLRSSIMELMRVGWIR